MTSSFVKTVLTAAALTGALTGCGPSAEQLALEGQLAQLETQLDEAAKRHAAAVQRAQTLETDKTGLVNERDSLQKNVARLRTARDAATAGADAAREELGRLLARIRDHGAALGVVLDADMAPGEAFTALELQNAERTEREAQTLARTAELAGQLDVAARSAAYLREQFARLDEEAETLRDGWRAEHQRSLSLNAALERARQAQSTTRAQLAEVGEDNVALARANALLRGDAETALAKATAATEAIDQVEARATALAAARDYMLGQVDVANEKRAAAEAQAAAAMQHAETMKAQLAERSEAAVRAARELEEASARSATLAGQLADVMAERDALTTELKAVTDPTISAGEVQAALESTLTAVRSANDAAQARVRARDEAFDALKEAANELRARIAEGEARQRALEEEIVSRAAAEAVVQSELEAAQRQANEVRERLEREIAELDGALSDAGMEHARLVQKMTLTEAAVDASDAEIEKAREATRRAVDEKAAIAATLDRLARELAAVRMERDELSSRLKIGTKG